MATTEVAARRLHAATVGTTAETWSLTKPVKEVRVTNRSAGALFVTVAVGENLAGAEAAIVTAVADADETFVVPANVTRTVFRSSRNTFVAGSVVGSTSTYDVEGTPWTDAYA